MNPLRGPTSLQKLLDSYDANTRLCLGCSFPAHEHCRNKIYSKIDDLQLVFADLRDLLSQGCDDHGPGLIDKLRSIAHTFSCSKHQQTSGYTSRFTYYWLACNLLPNVVECMGFVLGLLPGFNAGIDLEPRCKETACTMDHYCAFRVQALLDGLAIKKVWLLREASNFLTGQWLENIYYKSSPWRLGKILDARLANFNSNQDEVAILREAEQQWNTWHSMLPKYCTEADQALSIDGNCEGPWKPLDDGLGAKNTDIGNPSGPPRHVEAGTADDPSGVPSSTISMLSKDHHALVKRKEEKLITGPLFPNFQPWKGLRSRLTTAITREVFDVMKKPLSEKKQLDEGRIYTLRMISRPGYVKIGRTIQSIPQRKEQIKACLPYELEKINDGDSCMVPNHTRIEALVHTELQSYRRYFECPCKSKTRGKSHDCEGEDIMTQHGEWFEIDEKHACKVVGFWRRWMSTNPYSNGKLSSFQQAKVAHYANDQPLMEAMVKRTRMVESAGIGTVIWTRHNGPCICYGYASSFLKSGSSSPVVVAGIR